MPYELYNNVNPLINRFVKVKNALNYVKNEDDPGGIEDATIVTVVEYENDLPLTK